MKRMRRGGEIGSCYLLHYSSHSMSRRRRLEGGRHERGRPFSKVGSSHGECLQSNGSLYGVIQWFPTLHFSSWHLTKVMLKGQTITVMLECRNHGMRSAKDGESLFLPRITQRRRQEATKKNEMRTEDYADCHLYAHSQWMEQQFWIKLLKDYLDEGGGALE